MSGTNPFRRKNIHEEEPGTLRQENVETYHKQSGFRTPTIDTDIRRPTKKTVRIISPHSASSDNGSRIPDVLFSPPPISKTVKSQAGTPGSTDDDSSPDDPFDVESDDGGGNTEDDGLRRNTIENTGSSQKEALGKQRVPSNPFDRTPASTPLANVENGQATRLYATQPKPKPQYNVDEFTKLLLTGKKSTSNSTIPAVPPASSYVMSTGVGDSSSNTDASSISRQSIFEPASEARQDTPRTSHELSSSDEESVRSPLSTEEIMKPAAPQSQHGKPLADTNRAGLHQEPVFPPANNRSDEAAIGRPSAGSPRTPTDLNKPLPLPPTSEPSDPNHPDVLAHSMQPKLDQQPASPTIKKVPPAPPSSRRHGQAKPQPLSIASVQLPYPSAPDSPQSANPSSISRDQSMLPSDTPIKPPPPPPRRPGPSRGLSNSSTTSGVSMIPTPSSSNFSEDLNPTKSRPPVPPTRNRSSSSSKRQMTLPGQTGFTGLPPAPPPRRRGSSQSSFSPSRLSGEYQPSFTVRQRTDSGASSVQSKDVIADLSALQREVDALRGKFGT